MGYIEVRGPTRSNCLLWSVNRRIRKGGKLHVRRSVHIKWLPHFSWSRRPDSKRWGYAPLAPKHGLRALAHGIWFEGGIWREDADEC